MDDKCTENESLLGLSLNFFHCFWYYVPNVQYFLVHKLNQDMRKQDMCAWWVLISDCESVRFESSSLSACRMLESYIIHRIPQTILVCDDEQVNMSLRWAPVTENTISICLDKMLFSVQNHRYFFISPRTLMLRVLSRSASALLLSTHCICFRREVRKNIYLIPTLI